MAAPKLGGKRAEALQVVGQKLERKLGEVDAVLGLRIKLADQVNDGMMSFEGCKLNKDVVVRSTGNAPVAKTVQNVC